MKELQLENPSPVIGYKPRGMKDQRYPLLMEENFLLILMTEFQASVFGTFSTFACVDSTHKTNEYGYKLISMVVPDEFRNGKNHCIYNSAMQPCNHGLHKHTCACTVFLL